MNGGLEERIRARGLELGFRRVSFSPAGRAVRAEAFRGWLARGFAGEMAYLAKGPDDREDVTRRSPWARSVISVSLGYAGAGGRGPISFDRAVAPPGGGPGAVEGDGRPLEQASSQGISGFVSAYAQGDDYHRVLGERLERLASFVRDVDGSRREARVLVDTSAILERDHAASSGIGWTGKNAMVIDPEAGSYFFLGEILTDLDLTPGMEVQDLCGTCTRCIEACPTQAIVEPRVVDSRRCISYLTIELRGRIEADLRASMGEHLFGCDVCQEVCPWNHRAPESAEPTLGTSPSLAATSLEEAVSLGPEEFAVRFRGSAIARAKRSGFVRNALIVAGNRGDVEALRAGRETLDDADPVVRETAVWALARGDETERRAAARRAVSEPDPDVRRHMLEALDAAGFERNRPGVGRRQGLV